MAQPADIISRLRLDLDHTIFDLGCRERRITLQAQQVRGLNLAWALRESGQGIDGKRVVIVGAGAGGLTAALAFARQGAKVAVFEQSEVILPRFRGNSQRFLHPHAFDWPAESASLHDASLPLMNWKAGLASEVVAQLERAWSVERSTVRQLTLHLQSAIDKVDLKARTVQIRSSNAKTVPFDFLILAVGVGTERRRYGTPTYWENDALAQPSLRGSMSLLVSGNGDGGLVDVLRASLTDFDHARMMRQFLGSSDAYALGEAVRVIENRARLNPAFDLDTAYADLDLTRIARLVQGENRTQRQVTLSVSGPKLYRPDTMALNRVLVECLRRQGLEVLRSRVASVESCGDRLKIGFVNGTAREFDAAVFRHGPANDLAAVFPEIAQTAPPIDPNSADNARHPHWPKGYFSSRIDSRPTREEPMAYDVIELDSGFGLKSRAWSMNERGEVVGWTDLGTGHDHGFFVWGGTGLPPQRGNIPGIRNTAATDINDHGDYVVTTEGGSRQAWLVTGSRLIELPNDGDRAMPHALNNTRTVVGWSSGKKRPHACVWTANTVQPLPDLGFDGVALDINDAGIIVGELRMEHNGRMAAARWRDGRLETFAPSKPYYAARAFRINAHGLAVGYLMQESKSSDFFVWPLDRPPQIIDQGEAYGVNDAGWVTGRAGEKGAFLWRDGRMIWLDELVSPNWTIAWPFRLINDLRLVGVGVRNGIERAVLLVPKFS